MNSTGNVVSSFAAGGGAMSGSGIPNPYNSNPGIGGGSTGLRGVGASIITGSSHGGVLLMPNIKLNTNKMMIGN